MEEAVPGPSPEAIERRSWHLAAVMILASLLFRSPPVTGGVALGAVLAVLNFKWLRRFVRSLVSSGRQRPSPLFFIFYLFKYLFTGVAIFLAIKYDLADAVALLVGVSVIFLSICWEGIHAHFRVGEG